MTSFLFYLVWFLKILVCYSAAVGQWPNDKTFSIGFDISLYLTDLIGLLYLLSWFLSKFVS
jgi:hypothetical protein